jgi:uncharacterized membrane protein
MQDLEIQRMPKRYNILSRCIAALALMLVYVVGTSAVLVGATTTQAQARGGGGRGGGRGGGFARGRGFGWGRGWGRGVYVGPGCYWSRRWGRYICPY